MKRTILTGANDDQTELLALTAPVMLDYAIRHGVNFRCVTEYPSDTHPMWQKMALILAELMTSAQVIWADADMLITNPALTPWRGMASGLHVSRDWGSDATEDRHFTTACMVVNRDAIGVIELAVEHREEWHEAEFHEMAYLRSIFDSVRHHFHIHPRRVLNAVPVEVHPDAPEPWEPGDWLCHATNLPVADRIEVLKNYERYGTA